MKLRLPVVLTGVLALALAAGGGSAATKHRFAGKQPIVIGMPLALTGVISFYDQPNLAGAQLAVAQINARGGVLGRPLKIITGDTKSDLGLIAATAQQVVGKGAQFLIPTLDYDFGGPSARVGEAHKPPLISISNAGDPRFGRQGIGPHTFNQFPAGGGESAIAATFAWKQGWRHPFVLKDLSISYSKTFSDYFTEAWTKLAGASSIAGTDTFMNSDPSIANQITNLRSAIQSKQADFIFMGSYAPGGASATKQIRAAGINLPIIGGAGFDGTFWLGAVPDLKSFYVVAGGVTAPGADPNPRRRAVYDAYFKKFNRVAPLGEQTLNGYSAVVAFERAISRARSTSTDKVTAQLNRFRNEPLPIGNITWTPACHIDRTRGMAIVTFSGEQERFVAEVKPLARILPKALC
jgi:branched-chain amino acid transport system substrate-binding protein